MLTLLIGGARSGKSALAVQVGRAQQLPVTFIATGRAVDDDMAERIDRHRRERPREWTTVEEPLDLEAALVAVEDSELVIIDCLSLWTGAAMTAGRASVEDLAVRLAAVAAARPGPTVVVTNEVGMGVHPSSELGREYRDVHGRVNAIWARAADRVFLIVCGRALELSSTSMLFDAVR